MAGPYTVDASVFLNAFNPRETGHEISRGLLAQLRSSAVAIVAPTLLLPEIAGALARGGVGARLASRFIAAFRQLPHLTLIPLDVSLADRAADVAGRFRLRGSDAVYAAVAAQFGATLVTLDEEQRRRVSRVIRARLPADVISEVR